MKESETMEKVYLVHVPVKALYVLEVADAENASHAKAKIAQWLAQNPDALLEESEEMEIDIDEWDVQFDSIFVSDENAEEMKGGTGFHSDLEAELAMKIERMYQDAHDIRDRYISSVWKHRVLLETICLAILDERDGLKDVAARMLDELKRK